MAMKLGPLAGLRVIDCTRGLAGCFGTGLLADYGADVIRIEPPAGDPFQSIGYKVGNRSKHTESLDLKGREGLTRLHELLGAADLFVHSWRPGVAERLGLGYDELHARYPALVFGAISGYGPDDERRGYEGPVQAAVGMMAEQCGFRSVPIYGGVPFACFGAGYLLAIGAMAALCRRQRDGRGRRVETSLLDGALVYLAMMWLDSDVPAPYPKQDDPFRALAKAFQCGDGRWLGVHTGAVGAFNRCMDAVGLGEAFAVSDGRDLGAPLTPEQHRLILDELPKIFASRNRDEWLQTLLAADVCAIPVLDPGEIFDEPQALHNDMVVTVQDAELGPLTEVGIAAKFSRTPAAVSASVAWTATEAALEAAPTPAAEAAPLAGVKILDLGAYYAGPFGSRLLAGLGAEVIKLEPPGGDPLRGLDRAFFAAAQNKRSIAVDLKTAEGVAIGRRLAAWADVVCHNMRPGVAERLGLDDAAVRASNPSVIYAWSPGWGATGPDAMRQGFAPLYSGYAGVMMEVAGAGNPPIMPIGNEDTGNGLLGALAILMALYHRSRTGEGQAVLHPQLNATMVHMMHIVRNEGGQLLGRSTLDSEQLGLTPLQRLYRTRDGWLCIHATEAQWLELRRILEVAAAQQPDAGAIAKAMASRDSAEILMALRESGIAAEIPKGENWQAFLNDKANWRDGRVLVSDHPRLGSVRELGQFMRISDSAPALSYRAPLIGEHSREILLQLGYDEAQIAALASAKIVRLA
jgi:crotonobetainyl-CoA:carnitine CoA-transferase CaiB-like acyl-CoA transferase